jgi:hypothetical protein
MQSEDITARKATDEQLGNPAQAVGQLTGGIAHDALNLLAIIGNRNFFKST